MTERNVGLEMLGVISIGIVCFMGVLFVISTLARLSALELKVIRIECEDK
jgi:hypothetical protein